jgi:hypothetical protein
MTPSIIPNRDSMPQNHPIPNDAVSKLGGTAVSMGGTPFSMLMEDSFIFDSWLIDGSMVCEQVHKKNIEPKRIQNHPLPKWSFFFIAFHPFISKPKHVCNNDYRPTISMILDACVKI